MKNVNKNEADEIDCVKRFLPFFNRKESTNFSIVKHGNEQDDKNKIDVFVYNGENDCLKLQITLADYARVGQFKRSISEQEKLPFIIRDRHDIKIIKTFLSCIEKKVIKHKKDRVDKDIILLLDDYVGQIPKDTFRRYFVDRCCDILDKSFREIWYVGKDEAWEISNLTGKGGEL